MKFFTFSTVFIVTALAAGCSTTKPLSMESYKQDIYTACMESGKYNVDGAVTPESMEKCEFHSQHALETSETYYDYYESDATAAKCTDLKEEKQCVYDEKKAFYDKKIPELIQKLYPEESAE